MALETQESVGGIRVGKLGGSIMMGGLWGGGSGETSSGGEGSVGTVGGAAQGTAFNIE